VRIVAETSPRECLKPDGEPFQERSQSVLLDCEAFHERFERRRRSRCCGFLKGTSPNIEQAGVFERRSELPGKLTHG
jgi:hypothetical protein